MESAPSWLQLWRRWRELRRLRKIEWHFCEDCGAPMTIEEYGRSVHYCADCKELRALAEPAQTLTQFVYRESRAVDEVLRSRLDLEPRSFLAVPTKATLLCDVNVFGNILPSGSYVDSWYDAQHDHLVFQIDGTKYQFSGACAAHQPILKKLIPNLRPVS